MKQKPNVGFICVHNSCRSQMAQALGTLLASDVFNSYSAGSEVVDHINNDAIHTIKELYQYDMSNQHSKLIDDLPPLDIVITMGCNVSCPTLPCKHREDWGLDDPSGKDEVAFIKTAQTIQEKILKLKQDIELGKFQQL